MTKALEMQPTIIGNIIYDAIATQEDVDAAIACVKQTFALADPISIDSCKTCDLMYIDI